MHVLLTFSDGTGTDLDGRFVIETTPTTNALVFSFIGYLTQTVNIGERFTMNISLEPDVQSLSKFVVVGYSSQTSTSLTTAVTAVKGEELIKKSTRDRRVIFAHP